MPTLQKYSKEIMHITPLQMPTTLPTKSEDISIAKVRTVFTASPVYAVIRNM